MIITMTPDGGADVRIRAADGSRSDAELQGLSGQLVQAVFGRRPEVTVQAGDVYPLARAHVDGVFRPGPHPTFRFDGTALRAALVARGLPDMVLRLETPSVPERIRTDAGARRDGAAVEWQPLSGHPWAELRLRPRPGLWLIQMTVAVVCFGCLAAAFVMRDRIGISAGLAALAACGGGTVAVLALNVRTDDAGVAGLIGRNGLLPCALVPPLAFVAGVAALVVLAKNIRGRISAGRPPGRSH